MNEKAKTIKERVKSVLIDIPQTRENDRHLMLEIWNLEDPFMIYNSYEWFQSKFISCQLSDPESIIRARRKIQEQNPDLRRIKTKLFDDE